MSQDSLKVLKELSMLSSNMDILVKELREQNKRNSENTEQIKKLVSEKEKKPAVSEDTKAKDPQQAEGFFKNLTQSFAKEISANNKQLTDSITKQITGDLGGISKNMITPAEVKTDSPGQLMNAFAKSLFSGIPKLEKGGDVTKNGVALVGEKGPELVELKKDQRVISNQDFLLQEELKEMREKEAKKNQAQQNTSDLVTGSQNLTDSVTNSFGVKVPKKEIDDYRDEMRSLFADEYEKDPALLEEEIKSFIENYRETFDPSKFKSENQEQLKSIKDQAAASPAEELSRRDKRKKEKEEKKAEKEKLESVVTPTKPKLLDSLKTKGKELIGQEKAKLNQSLVQAGLLKETKKTETPKENVGGSKLETEQFDLASVKASDLNQLTERLKSKIKKPGEETTEKESPVATTRSEISESPASTSQTTTSVTKEAKQAETNSAMTQQDLKDIKALLGAIYKSLSGPLNIANDRPFRPNSNVL